MHPWLDGWDETTAIVCVQADLLGQARIWRRVGPDAVERTDTTFLTWFLATDLELLQHLPTRWLVGPSDGWSDELARSELGLVRFETDTSRGPSLRYLVLSHGLATVEPSLVAAYNGLHPTERIRSLADLSASKLLLLSPAEQYLTLSGRVYYRGLAYADVRRLQFDLETTGLDEQTDRIFMVSLRDSTGWRASLDTASMSEAELLERFVALVRERDPDVLENHNIFDFDLRFLLTRCRALGVPLAIGRDGSVPWPEPGVFRTRDRVERFRRWRVAGREVVDTLHAVKRHAVNAPDLRRHGLKAAARYFGFAKPDREYVDGPLIWTTFQSDPERVRRYAADDVEEVDELSLRLLEPTFWLAQHLPCTYEAIATDATPPGLIEPLLVRAYVRERHALPLERGMGRAAGGEEPGQLLEPAGIWWDLLFLRAEPLNAVLLQQLGQSARHDALRLLPWLAGEGLRRLEADGPPGQAFAELLDALGRYPSNPSSMMADRRLAAVLSREGQRLLDHVAAPFLERGAHLIEARTDTILLGSAQLSDEDWHQAALQQAQRAISPLVRLLPVARYQSGMVHDAGSYILLGADGAVTLTGDILRLASVEAYGEAFVREAAVPVLRGDWAGARQAFLRTVQRLRGFQYPVGDLSRRTTLHRSGADYLSGERHQDGAEALLHAGIRDWSAGHRVRYFISDSGQPRLLAETEVNDQTRIDAEHYVRRLRDEYASLFAPAFTPAAFAATFTIPSAPAY